jgi:hypothetical protein
LKPRLSSGVTRKFHLSFFGSSNRMGQIKISAFAKNPKQRLQDLALNMRTRALRAFFNIGICCFMIGAVYHEPKTLRAVCCSCQGSSLKRASNLYARKKTLCCSGRGSSLMAKTWCNLSSYSVNSHVHKQVEISPAQSLFLVRMVCILASCVHAIIRCFRELPMGSVRICRYSRPSG